MPKSPPFIGSKIIDDVPLGDFEHLLDRQALYFGRWQFKITSSNDDSKDVSIDKIAAIYEKIRAMIVSKGLFESKMVRGYFKCEKSGNNLIVRGEKKAYRFDFPRERIPPHRCLSDFFSDGFAAFQLVTIGSKVGDEISALFGKGGYSESFYLKGFAAEAAEALAKFSHSLIRKELGLGADAGERFSPGYPVFPSLLDQRSIVALLEVRRIGVNLTKTCMLVPEHTTSAIISPDATASRWGSNIIKNRCL